jgi:hypothetical protein
MKIVRLILPALLLASACFAQEVSYKYYPKANFSKYKTYKWVPIKDTAELDPLTDQLLKAATDAELAKKGLVKTEGAEADLFIGYQVAFRKGVEWSAYTELPGPGIVREGGSRWDWDPSTRPIGTTTTVSESLRIGDFGLDMYDAAQRQLIWRGDAAKTIEANVTPEKRKKNIEKGVAKLLKNYPPKNKK